MDETATPATGATPAVPVLPPMPRRLHIFYRHVHVKADARSRDPNKARPAWFSHQRCFHNLLQTIAADPQGSRVTVTVMYDSPLEDLLTDFMAGYIANTALGIRLQFVKGGSDRNSFLITLAFAHGQDLPGSDIVYFLENDYVHQHGWVSKVFDLYDSVRGIDIVSLYDHKDKYILPMYAHLRPQLLLSHSHHWRITPSSCASFLLEKAAFDRDYDLFSSGKTDYFFFGDLIEGRQRVMVSPIPGLSTHSMEGYTSPNVDWAALVGGPLAEPAPPATASAIEAAANDDTSEPRTERAAQSQATQATHASSTT